MSTVHDLPTQNIGEERLAVRKLWELVHEVNTHMQALWNEQTRSAEINLGQFIDSLINSDSARMQALAKLILDTVKKPEASAANPDSRIVYLSESLNFMHIAHQHFGDYLTRNEIFVEVREAILERHSIRFTAETIRQFAILADYFNQKVPLKVPMHRNDVFELLKKVPGISKNLAHGFLQLLLLERVVNILPSSPLFYRRRGHIYYFYLVNRLFGVLFDIPGLNFLFENGLLMPPDQGMSMLVTGTPGTGKTTLSLQMAVEIARQGGLALYLATEQSIDSLRQAIVSFGWEDRSRFVIMSNDEDLEQQISPDVSEKGILVLSNLTKWNFDETLVALRRTMSQFGRVVRKRRIVVIDSLSTLRYPDDDPGSGAAESSVSGILAAEYHRVRDCIESILEVVKAEKCLAVCIGELGHRHDDAKTAEYLCDIHVKLSIPDSEDDYSIRQIRISKCRSQHVQRGNHHFLIRRESGIEIYPSCAAVLSAREGRERTTIEDRSIKIEVNGFREILGTTGILKNTVTGITGEPGTGKSMLAQCIFLSPTVDTDLSRKTFLYISFKDNSDRILRRFNAVAQLRRLWATIKEQVDIDFLLVRPGYTSPGMLLSHVVKVITERKERQLPITRVLLDDLIQIPQQLPLVYQQPMFFPALLEVFATEGITTIMSCSTYSSIAPSMELQVRSLCDYLFVSRSMSEQPGRSRKIMLSVIKSFERSHSNREMELVVSGDKMEVQSLAVAG